MRLVTTLSLLGEGPLWDGERMLPSPTPWCMIIIIIIIILYYIILYYIILCANFN
jgi:hypothetical protein